MIKNLVDSYKNVFRPKRFGRDVQRREWFISIGGNRVAERGVTKPWRVQSQLIITCSNFNQQSATSFLDRLRRILLRSMGFTLASVHS